MLMISNLHTLKHPILLWFVLAFVVSCHSVNQLLGADEYQVPNIC